jgi:hypothetical protein
MFGELIIGQPLFPGESSLDQVVQIIKIVGTPTREEVCAAALLWYPLVTATSHSWLHAVLRGARWTP